MSKKFNFFKEAIKNYKTSGTIVPSSRFLADKMLEDINFSTANLIVELGPGNGAITHRILKKLHPKTTLVCFEINNVFYNELLKIEHPQFVVLKKSAEKIKKEINHLNFKEVDYIISSLPLTIIPKEISHKILQDGKDILKKNGVFIQYQYTLTYHKKLQQVFGKNIKLGFEPLNFPPAFVYKCSKK